MRPGGAGIPDDRRRTDPSSTIVAFVVTWVGRRASRRRRASRSGRIPTTTPPFRCSPPRSRRLDRVPRGDMARIAAARHRRRSGRLRTDRSVRSTCWACRSAWRPNCCSSRSSTCRCVRCGRDVFDDEALTETAKDLIDRADGGLIVVLFLLVVIGAPVVEEVVYRGLLQRPLLDRFLRCRSSSVWRRCSRSSTSARSSTRAVRRRVGVRRAARGGPVGSGWQSRRTSRFNATGLALAL